MPFAKTDLARGDVLSQTLFSGTPSRDTVEIAAELQAVGGALGASTDPDRLLISGNTLATGVPRLLEILADVLEHANYPKGEVATERERIADRIQVMRSQPGHLARVALLRRIYGSHPYAVQTPSPDEVRDVRPGGLRKLHGDRVVPNGATLVVVGDINADRTIDQVEAALAGWTGGGKPVVLSPIPALRPGPIELIDRPGSVQSSMRLALPAVGRTHPDFPALQLANLIFGGYFSSRWTENIREDKGYTYGPHSGVEHSIAGSSLVLSAEVATDVTAPALLETWYELGRLATAGAQGRRAGAGPAVRDRLATARHVDAGRTGEPGQHVRRLRPTAGLSRRVRGGSGPLDPRRRGRGGGQVPRAREGGHRHPRRRRPGRTVAGAARAGGTGHGRVTEPLDRAAHHRTDPQWLADAWPRARVIVVDSPDLITGRALVRGPIAVFGRPQRICRAA